MRAQEAASGVAAKPSTVGWRLRDTPDDRLATYDAVVGWAQAADVLGPSQAKRLLRIASQHPREARTPVHDNRPSHSASSRAE